MGGRGDALPGESAEAFEIPDRKRAPVHPDLEHLVEVAIVESNPSQPTLIRERHIRPETVAGLK